MSHGSTAKLVRLSKERHPEFYCSTLGCLFRTETALGHRECPKHNAATRQHLADVRTAQHAEWEKTMARHVASFKGENQ